MNRLWKGQEQDWGIDLCWQLNGAGDGTILRTKGGRHDRHTAFQQAFREAWCGCDVEYSNLPQTEKDTWRYLANEYNRNHGTNLSGYNLFMKRCTAPKYAEIRAEFEGEDPAFWEPWSPESWGEWQIISGGGNAEPVTDPSIDGADWSLGMFHTMEAKHVSREWTRGQMISGYFWYDGDPWIQFKLRPADDDLPQWVEYRLLFVPDFAGAELSIVPEEGDVKAVADEFTAPPHSWMFFELVIAEPDFNMFSLWDDHDHVLTSLLLSDDEFDYGYLQIERREEGYGTMYISPLYLQDI